MNVVKINTKEGYDRLLSKSSGQIENFDLAYNQLKTFDNLFVYIQNNDTKFDDYVRFDTQSSDYLDLYLNDLLQMKIDHFEMNIIYKLFLEDTYFDISHMVCDELFVFEPNKKFLTPYIRKNKIKNILKQIE